MDTTDKDSIIERIRKLLALAANNTNPHEAELAAQRANELMLKHSIERERVNTAVDPLSGYVREIETTGKFAAWERTLLVNIALANLCRVVKVGRDDFAVIGHKENVQVSLEMFRWLRTELHRLAKEKYREADESSDFGEMDPHQFHTSFKHGANNAINERLKEAKREVEKFNPSQAHGLVLLNTKADQALVKFYPKTVTTRSSAGRNTRSTAFSAGVEAGRSVTLKPTKLLK